MMARQWRCIATPLAFVGLFVGCEEAAVDSRPLFAGPQRVAVTMTEYRYDHDRPIRSGRVLFTVRNIGKLNHSLTMYPLSEDVPPIDEQIRGPNRRSVRTFAETRGLKPGESTTIAVDLLPGGRYAFLCFIADSEGTPHALKGMNSEFRASGPHPPAPGTTATPTVASSPAPATGSSLSPTKP